MVGAIVLSPTDAASQKAVVGSAQRVVVARVRATCDAAVHHYLEYLGSEHPYFELEGSARSVVYFRKLHHALRKHRLTSVDRSAMWLTFPSRYTNSFVWLYTWLATSTLNVAVDSGIPFVRKYIISVLASATVRPAARGISRRLALRQLLSPVPPPPFSSSGAPKRPRCLCPHRNLCRPRL